MNRTQIAEVVFDLPVAHPFSYSVPPHLTVVPGQRVQAPLGGAVRPGVVVGLRALDTAGVKPLAAALEPGPIMSRSQLDFARWISAESCSSLGSTSAALLPPVLPGEPMPSACEWSGNRAETPELFVGADRLARVRREIEAHAGGVLLLTADIATAADWAASLSALGPVARLDSGIADRDRRRAWNALAAGAARLAVGTRSALLAPIPPPAMLVLIDEHEAAHKPPGAPRIHSRDVVLRRAALEGARLLLPSATPSVEIWWLADGGRARLHPVDPGSWPAVSVADTRGMLRADPLTPALGRAAYDALARGRRVCLLVSRLSSALACDDCGSVPRCPECGIALAFSRVEKTLACRFCARRDAAPDTCGACGGRRLSAFGWGAERVEHALRRRFPRARIARYDPDAMRGARLAKQRQEATGADIVIGTRGALRLFEPASLGLAGFVTPDQFLRVADFRASERAFALMWAAAERVRPDGQVVIQSQHHDHYILRAVIDQDRAEFYKHELRFRAESGYPPFRRLCRVTARGRSASAARALADTCVGRLRDARLTVYPAIAERRGLAWRILVKGRADLPAHVSRALEDGGPADRRGRGMIEIEMDPVD
ncbi:MAG: primosomal protein N' [Candidatus Rokuibacteriota bacterium]|nr:MAG: primosomal protein N' [Candidatus Rokubacteria bacterium]